MRKSLCLLPALALALLCACGKADTKTPPTRPADLISTERQLTAPSDGDTIAIFDTSLGRGARPCSTGRRADGSVQFCGAGPQRILR